jgi:hypothetical protein
VERDRILYGTGILRVFPWGAEARIPPDEVYIHSNLPAPGSDALAAAHAELTRLQSRIRHLESAGGIVETLTPDDPETNRKAWEVVEAIAPGLAGPRGDHPGDSPVFREAFRAGAAFSSMPHGDGTLMGDDASLMADGYRLVSRGGEGE